MERLPAKLLFLKWAALSSLGLRVSGLESSLLSRSELLLICAGRAGWEETGGKKGSGLNSEEVPKGKLQGSG